MIPSQKANVQVESQVIGVKVRASPFRFWIVKSKALRFKAPSHMATALTHTINSILQSMSQ